MNTRFILLVLVIGVPHGGGCSPGRVTLDRLEYSRALMGTEARIVVWAPSETEAGAAAAAAFDRIAALDRVMSDWREDTELSELCAQAGRGPVPVSADLMRVLTRAVAVAAASDGAFDPTIGPLVRRWREARRLGKRPPHADLASAREKVGWRLLTVDPGGGTVALAREGMSLDLGGIGKGFACDEALRVLAGLGLSRALVSLGGDVVCGDPPPGSRGWEIAMGAAGERLTLANAAVSSSGDAEQFVEIDGVRYSHVVDPFTGLGLTGSPTVTVVAADGVTADALATAVSVLGEERGRSLVAGFAGARIARCARR